jgi:hypothetical protein
MASHLSEEDKAKMRTLIIYNLKPTELAQAKTYIGSQVRDEIIKGEKIDDPELQQMLLSLSPKNAAKMMTEYPPAIYVLFSKLTPKFLSMIIEELDEAKRAMILSEAITQKPVDAEDMQAFKTKLTKYSEVELYSPALEKIKLMLPSSTLSTEESLYNVMAMHGNAQSIKTCALKHIPYQLISSMPEELLKESLLSYDSVKRIEYLETLAGDEKDFLLNAFAPAGSKARDIYEMDYERVLADTTAVDKINTNQDAISKHFIFHLRELIRKSPQYQSKIESAVMTWAENLMAQKVSKTKLKVAV